MQKPRQRFVELGNAVKLTAGLFLIVCSSTAYFSERANDWILLSIWVSSLLIGTAKLISFFKARTLGPESPVTEGATVRLPDTYCDLLNAIKHGVIVIDQNLVVKYANKAFYQLVTDDNTQLTDKPISEVFLQAYPGHPTSISYRLACLALESGTEQSASFDLPFANDSLCHLHITATPFTTGEGIHNGVLILYQDRTAEWELQETVRRHDQMETVSQMAASIAHEVRNPMTSVQGFLQLMSREIDPAHSHSMYLHVMEEDLKRINSIITEYLNFSRMGSDSLEDVWIGTLVHNTYTLLQSEANLKGIHIVLSLLGNNPLMIANPNRLKQVLINLARNAMEAMSEQGGGTLTLSLETSDDHICLMVKDTGPGIPKDVYEQVFQPFYTTKPTGTGLGLFISKQIIEEHNGTIEVESGPEIGTMFRIYLPKNRLFENQ